jgi:hypothetical protein
MSRALAEAPFSISPFGENTTNLLGNEAKVAPTREEDAVDLCFIFPRFPTTINIFTLSSSQVYASELAPFFSIS